MNIVNFSIDNELIGGRQLGTNVHRQLKSTLSLNTFKSFKPIDQLNQQTLFNQNHFTSKLPFILREQEFDLTKTNLNKVFTSQWLDDRKIIMGTKCNKLVVLDTVTGQYSIQNPIESHPNSKNIQNHCGIHSISVNPSRTLLATGAEHVNDIGIYTLPDLEPVACGYNAHSYWIFDIVWLDDQHVVSGAGDNRLALWTINVDNNNNNKCPKNDNSILKSSYVNKKKIKKKYSQSRSANSSFTNPTHHVGSSQVATTSTNSGNSSWFNFFLNRNTTSSSTSTWRDRRFLKRPTSTSNSTSPSFLSTSSFNRIFSNNTTNNNRSSSNEQINPASSSSSSNSFATSTLNNNFFRHRFNFRYDLPGRPHHINNNFNIYNINNNNISNNRHNFNWRSSSIRSSFQAHSSTRPFSNFNEINYDNDFFDINEEERDQDDPSELEEMDDNSFINYETNNNSSDIEIFNNEEDEDDDDDDENDDDDDDDDDDLFESISNENSSEDEEDDEDTSNDNTNWTSPSSSRSQPTTQRRRNDDSQSDDYFDLSHLKRRRLNTMGKYKHSNGSCVKYKMPTKIIKCKQSKRIRALAYNPKRNEIAAISMNAAFHYFDVRRFEQKYTKKLSPLKENVCLTIDNDYSIYAIGSASHVQLLDANNARPLTTPIFVKKDIGIRSLHFRNQILSIGTGIGTVLFYDLRAKNFLNYDSAQPFNNVKNQTNVSLDSQYKLQTNGGWIVSIYFTIFKSLEIKFNFFCF